MTPARLDPAAPQSRVKHTTTEPLRSYPNPIVTMLHLALNRYQIDFHAYAVYKKNYQQINESNLIYSTDEESIVCKACLFISFLDNGDFCRLLITFENSLEPDQARHNVGSDLDPNCLTF